LRQGSTYSTIDIGQKNVVVNFVDLKSIHITLTFVAIRKENLYTAVSLSKKKSYQIENKFPLLPPLFFLQTTRASAFAA